MNDLIPYDPPSTGGLVPARSIAEMIQARETLKEFVSGVLIPEQDYGVVPGTDKRSLLQPGAQKLKGLFSLTHDFEELEVVQDWRGESHGGEPFFQFRHKCILSYQGMPVGSGIGSCNSWEKKYRFRQAERICPQCGKPAIIKGREEYGGGWLCFAKKGGCGAKFHDDAPEIVNQSVGQVANTDIYDQVNTIEKMSQKRAMVAAVLNVTGASDFFTQDMEDRADTPHEPPPPPPPANVPAPPKTNPKPPPAPKAAEAAVAEVAATITPEVQEAAAAFKRSAIALGMSYMALETSRRGEWIGRLMGQDSPVNFLKMAKSDWHKARQPLDAFLKATEGNEEARKPENILELCKEAIHRLPANLFLLSRREWAKLRDAVQGGVSAPPVPTESDPPAPPPNPRGRFFAMCQEAGLWQEKDSADSQRAWMSKILTQKDGREVKLDSRSELTDADYRYLCDALEMEADTLLADAAHPEEEAVAV